MENTITVALVQYENRTGNRIGSCDLCYGPADKIHEGTLVETEFGFGKVIETDLIFTGADKLFQMLQKSAGKAIKIINVIIPMEYDTEEGEDDGKQDAVSD